MPTIKKSMIPAYLRASKFYRSLGEEGDEEITVEESNMKSDSNVKTSADLVHMLATARFWGLDELPALALHYPMFVCEEDIFKQIEEFEDSAKTVECLKAIRSAEGNQKFHRAIEFGRIDFIRYLLTTGLVLMLSDGVHAASKGQLECLEFITSKLEEKTGSPYHYMKLYDLPTNIDVECLKHICRHGARLDSTCIASAASVGNLPVVKYLHERGFQANKRALTSAARFGNLECVTLIHEQAKIPLDVEVAVAAASNGHIEVLKYLFDHGCPTGRKISVAAAEDGHLECLKFLRERGLPVTKATMDAALTLDCIKYLHEQKVPWDHDIYPFPLRTNRLDWLQYFEDQGLKCSKLPTSSHHYACTPTGESLRFLYQHGARISSNVVQEYMIACDNLVCLKIALQCGYKPEPTDCAYAVVKRATQCLQHLIAVRCPMDSTVASIPARRGDLETLTYLVQNGCRLDSSVARIPTEKGYLEMLTYLHQHGCPCDASTTAAAAALPSLDCLKYLHEHGVAWNADTLTAALTHGRTACLQYALDHNCPCNLNTANAAARAGNLQCLTYLHERGCKCDASTTAAAASAPSVECLKYLHEHGVAWNERTCAEAAGKDRLVNLQYAHANGCPWDQRAYKAARASKTCLAYLELHGCPKTAEAAGKAPGAAAVGTAGAAKAAAARLVMPPAKKQKLL